MKEIDMAEMAPYSLTAFGYLCWRPAVSTYSLRTNIPACQVKRDLLSQLENYVLQKANDLLQPNEKLYRYTITVKDSNGGSLEVHRVEELTFPLAGDTESIELRYGSMGLGCFSVTIRFDLDSPGLMSS